MASGSSFSGGVTADAVTTYQTAVSDVTGAAQTFSPTANLVSVTVRNRNATTATIQVNGGAVLPLDVGESWSVDLSGQDVNDFLNDVVVVNPGNGSVRVTRVRRI